VDEPTTLINVIDSWVRITRDVSYAAVYPNLRAGLYTVEESGQRVVIIGGRVTEVDFEIS
jgi:hypothetical protein